MMFKLRNFIYLSKFIYLNNQVQNQSIKFCKYLIKYCWTRSIFRPHCVVNLKFLPDNKL